MAYKCEILFGKITRVNGYDGSVTIKLEQSFYDNIPDLESVFIEINGKPVPFFIASSYYSGRDNLKLLLDGYETYEKVSEFVGCRIFLVSPMDGIIEQVENIIDFTGFKVLHDNGILIGSVSEIIKTPGHDLLKVITGKGKEVLIPWHDDFITSLEPENKEIFVVLPEGLSDIN